MNRTCACGAPIDDRENERLRLRVRELESVVGLGVDALREQLSAAQERVKELKSQVRTLTYGYPMQSVVVPYMSDESELKTWVPNLREIERLKERVRVLEELARHMWVHDGYPQNGYLKMSTEQKHLYCDIVGAEFTPLAPDLDTTSVDASDAALAAEPGKEKP